MYWTGPGYQSNVSVSMQGMSWHTWRGRFHGRRLSRSYKPDGSSPKTAIRVVDFLRPGFRHLADCGRWLGRRIRFPHLDVADRVRPTGASQCHALRSVMDRTPNLSRRNFLQGRTIPASGIRPPGVSKDGLDACTAAQRASKLARQALFLSFTGFRLSNSPSASAPFAANARMPARSPCSVRTRRGDFPIQWPYLMPASQNPASPASPAVTPVPSRRFTSGLASVVPLFRNWTRTRAADAARASAFVRPVRSP